MCLNTSVLGVHLSLIELVPCEHTGKLPYLKQEELFLPKHGTGVFNTSSFRAPVGGSD
jgi:hypothetical protein